MPTITSNKILGTLALIGAPFLFICFNVENVNKPLADTWFTAVSGFIYITAWMCSVAALWRLEATGRSRFGKALLWVIMASLIIANVSNIYLLFVPNNQPPYFFYLDMFWPLSNLIMLVVGITVVAAKRLQGWKRFVPLLVGLWLPVGATAMMIFGRTPITGMIAGIYSAIAWSLLAIVILTSTNERKIAFPDYKHYFQIL